MNQNDEIKGHDSSNSFTDESTRALNDSITMLKQPVTLENKPEQRQTKANLSQKCCNTCTVKSKIVSRYDQEIPQSQTVDNPWHREEEPLNQHETPGRQIQQSNQLSLPHQDDCNTRMDIKKRTKNIEQLQTPTMGVTLNKESKTTEPPP